MNLLLYQAIFSPLTQCKRMLQRQFVACLTPPFFPRSLFATSKRRPNSCIFPHNPGHIRPQIRWVSQTPHNPPEHLQSAGPPYPITPPLEDAWASSPQRVSADISRSVRYPEYLPPPAPSSLQSSRPDPWSVSLPRSNPIPCHSSKLLENRMTLPRPARAPDPPEKISTPSALRSDESYLSENPAGSRS